MSPVALRGAGKLYQKLCRIKKVDPNQPVRCSQLLIAECLMHGFPFNIYYHASTIQKNATTRKHMYANLIQDETIPEASISRRSCYEHPRFNWLRAFRCVLFLSTLTNISSITIGGHQKFSVTFIIQYSVATSQSSERLYITNGY